MRVFIAILLACLTATAQTREELHRSHGNPISETFAARRGALVTVSYSETGRVCEMIVHSQPLTSSLDYPITKTLESKALTQIIDELVPVNERGKRLKGTFLNLTCLPLNNCSGVMDDYERLTILRVGGNDKERYARIRWKAITCRE